MEALSIIILQCLFWVAVLGIVHTYFLYPWTMTRWKPSVHRTADRPVSAVPNSPPHLFVVMAVYNEESVLSKTLQSILQSDYPANKLTLLIGSDNSTDRSHEIIREFQKNHDNLNLEIFGSRNGKIKIINALVQRISEEKDQVLVLCDANVVWSRELAKNLARHFADPSVGIVASCVLDGEAKNEGIAAQEQAYVNHENLVKYHEGLRWGRMMGAFGACYALRREVYETVPENFNVDDFYETMVCYEKGYKGLVDLEAICYEAVSVDIREEFRRKKRIAKGNFQNLTRFSRFLLPWNCGLPTWFAFWSHKGLRWLGALLITLIILSGSILMIKGPTFYYYSMMILLISLALAGVDKAVELLGRKENLRLCRFIRYFYSMNLALFLGGIEFLRGVKHSIWEPTRRVNS